MTEPSRKPLDYTFGNHMPWAHRTWLWGHDVIPRSVRDMLALTREVGLRGNLSLDVPGYEHLALEDPEAMSELRAAVQAGTIEIVGASYGQPCGLFHGGESNVRQRLLGARAVRRLFGVWPRAFWAHELDFFPQLPQLLAGTGFASACLFARGGASTPELPEEEAPLVLWEGLDGTCLPTIPFGPTCCGPTAAELERALAAPALAASDAPALVQWLQLLPGAQSVCSSERLAPRLRELMVDERFELRARTLSELVAARAESRPPRRAYGLDQVFHGASLGKNADLVPRASRAAEEQLLAAESVSALAGLLGRPYPSWDVYPHWELEQAWKQLCIAQHHDVHAREGLCGAIGERYFETSQGLAAEVFGRTLDMLAARVDAPEGKTLVYNALSWARDMALAPEAGGGVVRDVPAYGYRVVDSYDVEESRLGAVEMRSDEAVLSFERRDFRVEIDRANGRVIQVWSREFPEGVFEAGRGPGRLQMLRGGEREEFDSVSFLGEVGEEEWAEYAFAREGAAGGQLRVVYGIAPLHDALWMRIVGEELARPDGGASSGLSLDLEPALDPSVEQVLLHDHPYGISSMRAEGEHLRRYPPRSPGSSEPLEERLRGPFSASSLVDLCEGAPDGRGLLVVHDGSQAWFREGRGLRCLLDAHDPWDGEYFDGTFEAELALMPHGPLSHTARMRSSMELNLGTPRFADHVTVRAGGDLPPSFGALAVDAPNVLATSFHRVGVRDAAHVEGHFAQRCGARDPFVVRLVEFEGRSADVLVRVPGPLACAARTDLLGAVTEELAVTAARAPAGPREIPWSAVRLSLRPHEVATLMLDLELGRQSARES